MKENFKTLKLCIKKQTINQTFDCGFPIGQISLSNFLKQNKQTETLSNWRLKSFRDSTKKLFKKEH